MNRSVLIILVFLLGSAQYLSAQDVYKTPSGAKYHLATCRMVENVSEKITVEEADKLGLDPCKICKPATTISYNLASNNQTPKGQSSTTQCRGRTKKGTRCLHRTSIADGYCFQHKPK